MADKDSSIKAPLRVRDPVGYWRANRALILGLLFIWAFVSYGCSILFVEQLNALPPIGNLPLGFWFAQQGSIYVFVILIFVYAIAMDRIDRRYGVTEERPGK
jgi:putative solute:sodium symporter small subunit